MEITDFMKTLFLCMLYLTGILACFFIMINFIEITLEKKSTKKHVEVKAVNVEDLDLDEETKKTIDELANKLAKKYVNEILSDEYEEED